MTDLTLKDFFQIGKNAAQLYPQSTPCLQPQAFRVLQRQRGTEVGEDNLGAVPTDKDNPFFWSRRWHNAKYNPNSISFEWPILTMFEAYSESKDSPMGDIFRRCYRVQLSVLDKYKEECTTIKHRGCEARTVNQIYIDTEKILDGVLKYFGKTVIATTDDCSTPKVYYLPWLIVQRENAGLNFDVLFELQDKLNAQNPTVRFGRVERPTQQIYGTEVFLNFCTTNCESIEYNLDIPDFGTVAFEAGCSNC